MKSISNDSQRGSAHVIIISVIAIALIGAVGFLFWSNFMQPKSDDTASTNTQKQTSSQQKASPSVSAGPKVDDTTIELSDWKVKFTIPPALKNTSVKYAETTVNGKKGYGFTTSRIEALGGDCATQPYGKSVVVNKLTAIPADAMDGFGVINQTAIDGYYYTYMETIPACSGDANQRVNSVEIADTSALVELVKSLKLSD